MSLTDILKKPITVGIIGLGLGVAGVGLYFRQLQPTNTYRTGFEDSIGGVKTTYILSKLKNDEFKPLYCTGKGPLTNEKNAITISSNCIPEGPYRELRIEQLNKDLKRIRDSLKPRK